MFFRPTPYPGGNLVKTKMIHEPNSFADILKKIACNFIQPFSHSNYVLKVYRGGFVQPPPKTDQRGTPRGGVHRTPPFYLRCLPTDFHEIFTSCHVWYKLSKKYRTCSLRPIWRQLWRHNDFLKNGFSRIFKLFIFDFWNKIFRDEIPSPICCLICYTFEKNKKMAGKNR